MIKNDSFKSLYSKMACPNCLTLIEVVEMVALTPLYPSKRTLFVSLTIEYAVTGGWWDTCSERRMVSPRVGSEEIHLPTNTSPRKGFNGFFSDPIDSLREQYCERSVEMKYLVTAITRRRVGSDVNEAPVADESIESLLILLAATNKSGCSPQYCENSHNDVLDKIKGGAVNDDKSPLNEAIDFMKEVHELDCATACDDSDILCFS